MKRVASSQAEAGKGRAGRKVQISGASEDVQREGGKRKGEPLESRCTRGGGGPEQDPDGPGDGVEVTAGAEATCYQ